METTITNLVLNTNFADINVGGFNADCTFNNINFRNLLGDKFELRAKYSIELSNICIDAFALSNFRKAGEIRILSNSMLFINNYNTLNNYGSFMFTASTSPLAISYNLISNNTFILTSETGYIEMINWNMNNNVMFTSAMSSMSLYFNIRKITNKIPKLLTENINSTLLILDHRYADYNLDNNHCILKWRNINFKTLLGDQYELNALYNIKYHSMLVNDTVVSSNYRVGVIDFECSIMTTRYDNSNNKWLIPFTHTNVAPNSRRFRGAVTNTFMLTSEQGDITTSYKSQNFIFILYLQLHYHLRYNIS